MPEIAKCDGSIVNSEFPESYVYRITSASPDRDTLPCRFFQPTNAERFDYNPNAFDLGAHFMSAYHHAYGEMPLAESYKNPHVSEMTQLLQTEQATKGDREVKLHGHYGAESSTFEVMPDKHVTPEDRDKLNIWTDIMTG